MTCRDLAVKESRLGIPLLIGYESSTDTGLSFRSPWARQRHSMLSIWASTAREAAMEAAADGLAMTFAPMLDVARDPRWGRIAEGPGEDPARGSSWPRPRCKGSRGRI